MPKRYASVVHQLRLHTLYNIEWQWNVEVERTGTCSGFERPGIPI